MKFRDIEVEKGMPTYCTLFGKGNIVYFDDEGFDIHYYRKLRVQYSYEGIIMSATGSDEIASIEVYGLERLKEVKPTLYFRNPELYGFELAKNPIPKEFIDFLKININNCDKPDDCHKWITYNNNELVYFSIKPTYEDDGWVGEGFCDWHGISFKQTIVDNDIVDNCIIHRSDFEEIFNES